MIEEDRDPPAVSESADRGSTIRWAGTVIMIGGAAACIAAVVQERWLTVAYFVVTITYGALLRWAWPFVTRSSRTAALVVVISSLVLVTAIIWRDFF